MGLFETELHPKIFSKQVKYENIGTKSINMSNIMVYFAMFSATPPFWTRSKVSPLFSLESFPNLINWEMLTKFYFGYNLALVGVTIEKIARLRPAAIAIYSIQCLEFIQLCIVFHA